MFELPEYTIIARQMNERIRGSTVREGGLGNSPHKFVWYNRSHEEFAQLSQGRRVLSLPFLSGVKSAPAIDWWRDGKTAIRRRHLNRTGHRQAGTST